MSRLAMENIAMTLNISLVDSYIQRKKTDNADIKDIK